jgi:hypothetical protein
MPKRGSYIRSKSVCIRITWISQFKKKRCKRSEKKCPWRVCVGWARVAVLPSLSSAGCHRSRAFCCDFFLLSAREMCRERELAQVKFYDFFLFFFPHRLSNFTCDIRLLGVFKKERINRAHPMISTISLDGPIQSASVIQYSKCVLFYTEPIHR